MKNFRTFYLEEKVSRKEIDVVLSNKNIVVGAEFEFYANSLDMYGGENPSDAYDNAKSDWESWNQDYNRFHEEMEENSTKRYESEQKVDELESDIAYLDEPEELGGGDTEYFDYMKDVMKIGNPVENSDWSEIKIYKRPEKSEQLVFKYSVEDQEWLYKKALEMWEDWREEFDEYSKERHRLEDELEKAKEEFEDAENEDIYPPDDIGEDYLNYMEMWHGYSNSDCVRETGDFGYSIYMEPFEPDDSEETDASDIESNTNFMGDLDSAPFKKYEIGDYHDVKQKVGSGLWAIETDASLGPGGIEIKSPPLSLPAFMKVLPKMLDWIEDIGTTRTKGGQQCGFHIHMSLRGVKNLKDVLDEVKLVLLFDEEYVYKSFKDREMSNYVIKMKHRSKLDEDDIKQLIDKKKVRNRVYRSHSSGINLESLNSGHMEFRYMGGNNYSRKLNKIIPVLGNYAHTFSAACDFNFMRKEYLQKLSRIKNMIDYTIIERELEYLVTYTNLMKKDDVLPRDIQKEALKVLTLLTTQKQKQKNQLGKIRSSLEYLRRTATLIEQNVAKQIEEKFKKNPKLKRPELIKLIMKDVLVLW